MTATALLLSGGMDSFALAYQHRPDLVITVDYGQRPAHAEIRAAGRLAETLGLHHEVVAADLSDLGSGDLSGRPALDVAPVSEWWPYRNQLLITLGAMCAIRYGVQRILMATVKSDSVHVDGTQAFLDDIDRLIRRQEGQISVVAPAIHLTTQELVGESEIPLSLLAWAHSCHSENIACGRCRGCQKNRTIWEDLETDASF